MRVILSGDPEHLPRALAIAQGEINKSTLELHASYSCWSASYPSATFLVRRTKTGFSVAVSTDFLEGQP